MEHNEAIAALTESIYIQPKDVVGVGFISDVNTCDVETMEVTYRGQSFTKPTRHLDQEITVKLDYMTRELTAMIMSGDVKVVIIKHRGDLHV